MLPGNLTKRVFDATVAGIALAVLSPVMIVLALAIRLRLGPSVLFRQLRPGYRGIPFILLKFRTMRDSTDDSGLPLDDSKRLDRFGRWVRSTSLDELPQLWNVLKGDMSIVGPRPLLMEYLPLYTQEQARRHNVRPGLVGWAQVNGRNESSWEQRLALDVWYVDHQSFGLDMRILVRGVRVTLMRKGISHGSEATMHRFKGTPR